MKGEGDIREKILEIFKTNTHHHIDTYDDITIDFNDFNPKAAVKQIMPLINAQVEEAKKRQDTALFKMFNEGKKQERERIVKLLDDMFERKAFVDLNEIY